MGRATPTSALVKQNNAVRARIEVPPGIDSAAGSGTAMKDEGGLPCGISTGLPIHAMPIPDVEHASIVRFNGWVQVGHGPVYHFCAVAPENELDGRR